MREIKRVVIVERGRGRIIGIIHILRAWGERNIRSIRRLLWISKNTSSDHLFAYYHKTIKKKAFLCMIDI